MLDDKCWAISDSGHTKKSPYAGKSEIEYLRVCVRLEGFTSVPPSLQIRFKSVPSPFQVRSQKYGKKRRQREGKEKAKLMFCRRQVFQGRIYFSKC